MLDFCVAKWLHILLLCFFQQIFIGSSRREVIKNQDVLKDLLPGMLIAIKGTSFPQLAKVTAIPPNPTLETTIDVQWLRQEKAAHKPWWSRFFIIATSCGTILINDIILYDFQLTSKGALKKKAHEYLQKQYQ